MQMIATETAPQSIVRCLGPCGAEIYSTYLSSVLESVFYIVVYWVTWCFDFVFSLSAISIAQDRGSFRARSVAALPTSAQVSICYIDTIIPHLRRLFLIFARVVMQFDHDPRKIKS